MTTSNVNELSENFEETVKIAEALVGIETIQALEKTPAEKKAQPEQTEDVVGTEHGNTLSIEDQAASTYSNLVPLWDRFAENANKKSLIRVVKAATKWPLQDEVPKFQTRTEFDAFKALCTILDCKTIMISTVLEERIKKQKEANASENTGVSNV